MTFFRRSIFLSALVGLASAAFSAPPLTSLVSEHAPVVISIHDIPALLKNWEQSPWAKTWNDEEMKKFLAPLRAQVKVDQWDELCKAETGYTVSELLSLAKGDALLAATDLNDLVENPDTKEPPFIVAIEFGDNSAAVEKLLKQTSANKPNISEETEEFAGVTIHTRKDSAKSAELTIWAFVDGVWLVSPSKDRLTATVDAVKRGGVEHSLGQSEDFLRVKKRAADPHFIFWANLQSIYPIAQKAIAARNAANGAQPNPMGLDPAAILPALGLDALHEFYLTATVGDEATEVNSGLTYGESRGLIKLMANGEGPVAQPSFVPAKWIQVASAKYSLREAYATLEEIIEAVNPMISGMAQGQIKVFNKKLGIDFKRDFIGSLGDELITAQTLRSGAQESSTQLDQFFAVSLKNPDGFKNSVEALKGLAGPQADKLFDARDYLGYTIYTFVSPMGGAAGNSMSYTIANNYLFVGVGSAGAIESALQALKGNQPSFWAKPEVKQALADIPSNASAVGFSDLKAQIPVMVEALARSAALMGGGRKAGPDDDKPEGDTPPTPAKKESWVDLSAKPDFATLGKYWSEAVSYGYRDGAGIYYKSKIIHPK